MDRTKSLRFGNKEALRGGNDTKSAKSAQLRGFPSLDVLRGNKKEKII